MNYILFDDRQRENFLPLSYTNTLADMLFGMFTNRQRWQRFLQTEVSSLTVPHLREKFPTANQNENILINSRLIPSADLLKEITGMESGSKITHDGVVIAMRVKSEQVDKINSNDSIDSYYESVDEVELMSVRSNFEVSLIENLWDFFKMNGDMFSRDLSLLNKDDFKKKIGEGNTFLGDEIYIHKNAIINAAILNSNSGPIVIDEGAEVMEGSIIRGPFYLGKHSSVKLGAKIYGPTSIGEHSKVGGEVNNSIVNSYSNKGHDGFIGNSVLGQWCNLGADTNTSNLKNDYSVVKLWNYDKQSFVKSGLQFLGLVMGDHSKCGINTMFNTGTVIGVSCNLYGAGFQPNFVPSFSWGKPGSFTTYQFEKAMQVASKVMERRNIDLDGKETAVLKAVFEQSEDMRNKFH